MCWEVIMTDCIFIVQQDDSVTGLTKMCFGGKD